MYGNPLPTAAGGGVFLVFNLMKSLAETDKSIQDSDKFATELGATGMQKVSELTAASVELPPPTCSSSILVSAIRQANRSKRIQASGKSDKEKNQSPRTGQDELPTGSSPCALPPADPDAPHLAMEVGGSPKTRRQEDKRTNPG